MSSFHVKHFFFLLRLIPIAYFIITQSLLGFSCAWMKTEENAYRAKWNNGFPWETCKGLRRAAGPSWSSFVFCWHEALGVPLLRCLAFLKRKEECLCKFSGYCNLYNDNYSLDAGIPSFRPQKKNGRGYSYSLDAGKIL